MKTTENRKPRVAAVIASYRRDAELVRLLEALQRSEVRPDLVCVADNAGSEKTGELCRRSGADWIPLPANRGPGSAWNAGIAKVLDDDSVTHCFVLDDDVVPPPGALGGMLQVMESSECGAVAPLLFDDKGLLWGFPEPREAGLRQTIRRVTDDASAKTALGDGPHAFCWATGACMLYRRDVLGRCGRFREDFWMLGEDLEFSMRAAAECGGVFTTLVAVPHLPPPAGDPLAAALAHRAKFLALLQNLCFLAFRSPHSAHLRWYLPGNFRRYLRTQGCNTGAICDVFSTFWHGAVRGEPAGTPSGERIRSRAGKRLNSDRL